MHKSVQTAHHEPAGLEQRLCSGVLAWNTNHFVKVRMSKMELIGPKKYHKAPNRRGFQRCGFLIRLVDVIKRNGDPRDTGTSGSGISRCSGASAETAERRSPPARWKTLPKFELAVILMY